MMNKDATYAFVDESNRIVSPLFNSIKSAFGFLPKFNIDGTRATIKEICAMRHLNEKESAEWMYLWNKKS